MDMSEDDELLGGDRGTPGSPCPPSGDTSAGSRSVPVDVGEDSDEEFDDVPMRTSRVCNIECAHSTLGCLLCQLLCTIPALVLVPSIAGVDRAGWAITTGALGLLVLCGCTVLCSYYRVYTVHVACRPIGILPGDLAAILIAAEASSELRTPEFGR